MDSKVALTVGAFTAEGVESTRPSSGRHRGDIDGLRAIAVSAVLLFHFFPQAAPGGYVGVDVFFVVSGFVVTRSIVLELILGDFRLKTFYMKRIRRLYPSLLLVILFCIVVSWSTDLAARFRDTNKEAVFALSYLINMHFARGPGYFDTSVSPSPLLHLWSLAVEEQFYLFWPVVTVLCFRLKKAMPFAAALIGVSFLAHSLVETRYPEVAFYVLPTRAWEFMIGAVIALAWDTFLHDGKLAQTPALQSIITASSATALITACSLYRPDGSYTAAMALVPALATGALICCPTSILNKKILSNDCFVWFGERSYSLYIWHWPFLIFSKKLFGDDLNVFSNLIVICLTIVSAHITYGYVELPIRMKSIAHLPRVASALLLAQMLLMAVGILSWRGIIPERHVELRPFSAAQQDWIDLERLTILKGKKPGRVLFFGDSYVAQFYPRLQRASQESDRNHKDVALLVSPGCAPILRINRRSNKSCLAFAEEGFRMAHDSVVSDVVIGGSWIGFLHRGDYYMTSNGAEVPVDPNTAAGNFVFDAFEAEIKSLTLSGKAVWLILTPPGDPKADPENLAKAHSATDLYINVAEHRSRVGSINQRLSEIARRTGAVPIDPEAWLCRENICSFVDNSRRPIFRDATHLRATYVRDNLKMLDRLMGIE